MLILHIFIGNLVHKKKVFFGFVCFFTVTCHMSFGHMSFGHMSFGHMSFGHMSFGHHSSSE
jgi:hypothetical protein